jgi:catechol 2,3-dioxygenase-like lactoylglutathione lyase family enzyme
MKIDRIDHFVLTVRDIEITVEFYTRVLGMESIVFGQGRRALAFGQQKINLHSVDTPLKPKTRVYEAANFVIGT